jgi:hypothetical protein
MAGSRGLTAADAGALAQRTLRPVLLFEAEFTSGDIQVFTGTGTLYTSDGRSGSASRCRSRSAPSPT